MDFNQIFDVCVVAAGIYMLYCGFTGKGSLYKNEYIKPDCKEQYKKFIQYFGLICGFIAIVTGVVDYLHIQPLTMIFVALFAVCLVFYFVINFRLTEPKKKK